MFFKTSSLNNYRTRVFFSLIMRPPNYNFSINTQKEDHDEHETESNYVEWLTRIANENNFT